MRADLDAVGGQLRLIELDEVADDLVQIVRREIELADPRELQKVFENGFQPPAFALDGDNLLEHAAIAGGLAGRNVLAQKLEVEADRGEGILDFMSQSAGEGGDLGKLGHQPLPFVRSEQSVNRHDFSRKGAMPIVQKRPPHKTP